MDRLNRQFRSEVREELAALRPTHMVTMNYPKPVSGGRDTRRRTVLTHLRQWNRHVLEALFGRKFSLWETVWETALGNCGKLCGKLGHGCLDIVGNCVGNCVGNWAMDAWT